MGNTYYRVEVHGGPEPHSWGPFREEKDRDDIAKIIHRAQKEDDSLFWANVNEERGLVVGSYLASFFLEGYDLMTD